MARGQSGVEPNKSWGWMVRVYRVQTNESSDHGSWTVEFFSNYIPAEHFAEKQKIRPVYLDKIEVGEKVDHVDLLNLAHANREALMQQCFVVPMKRWRE